MQFTKEVQRAAMVVLAVSLVLRLAWGALAHVTPRSDFATYDRIAWNWLETGIFGFDNGRAYRTPVYPGFLAGIYSLFGHQVKAAQLAQGCLGAISSALVVLVAGRYFSARASLLAGLLHAFSPTPLAYTAILASENVFVPVLLLVVLALQAVERAEGRRALMAAGLAGGLYALLLLTRPAGVFILPGVALAVLWSSRPIWQRAGVLASFGLAAAVVLSPWLARNYALGMGPLRLSNMVGVNVWAGNNDLSLDGGWSSPATRLLDDEMGEAAKNARYRRAGWEWIKSHPKRYLTLASIRLLRLIGLEADTQAASGLAPTRLNDEGMTAVYLESIGEYSQPSMLKHGQAVMERQVRFLEAYRSLYVSMVLTAMLMAIPRLRTLGWLLIMIACYTIGHAAISFEERFREGIEPLCTILVAAVLADILLREQNLGGGCSRLCKGLLLAFVTYVVLLLHATGLMAQWCRASPIAVDLAGMLRNLGYECREIDLDRSPHRYLSYWRYNSEVSVARTSAGLRCTIQADETDDPHYGGLRLPVDHPELVWIGLSFENPENIEVAYVDACDAEGHRLVRWECRGTATLVLPTREQFYRFSHARPMGSFVPTQAGSMGEATMLHVFVRVRTGTYAGLTVHRCAVGRTR